MKMTLSECEATAKRLLKKTAGDMFMELESLAICQESNRVFIVLKRKGSEHGVDREAEARP